MELFSLIFNGIGNFWYLFSQNLLNLIVISSIKLFQEEYVFDGTYNNDFLTNYLKIYIRVSVQGEYVWMWLIVSTCTSLDGYIDIIQ